MDEKTAAQMRLLENRLVKRKAHLKKWARRNGIFCYRLYDRDIPEIPLCIDFYEDTQSVRYLVLYLYERPYEKPTEEEKLWLDEAVRTCCDVLQIPHNNVFTKIRRRQKNRQNQAAQYEKQNEKDFFITVSENGLRFSVNLSAYLDTGLFFDHRILREKVRADAEHKRVLNLFCYTGAFSVYAAAGNARQVDSVDLSAPYLNRAQKNMALNGFTDEARFSFIRSDVPTFLKNASLSAPQKKWDIIVLDPPTFSNSKKTGTVLDINRDWPFLCSLCLNRLERGGKLYFSTNSKTLHFDENKILQESGASGIPKIGVSDISAQTIPEDFRNKRIHRCWLIKT